MHSSISSSKNIFIGRTIIWMLVILSVLLLALELFWRAQGHQPSIIDDMKLWSMEKESIREYDRHSIALLGASRMLTDFSPSLLKKLYPQYCVANLAVDGSSCIATLNDLANDEKFKGIAVCDITEEVIFRTDKSISQEPYVKFFHNNFKFNTKINRQISTFLQANLVIIDPYLNLIQYFGYYFSRGQLRPPRFLITHPDRSISEDFSLIDSKKNYQARKQININSYNSFSQRISFPEFKSRVASIDSMVKKIRSRGGNVVFIRFPLAEELYELDMKYFPKTQYWDYFSSHISCPTIHFLDEKLLSGYNFPDGSHIDKKDIKRFSLAIIDILIDHKILEQYKISKNNI